MDLEIILIITIKKPIAGIVIVFRDEGGEGWKEATGLEL